MGIQKDAGELLLFAYKRYCEKGEMVSKEKFIEESGWDEIRTHNAFNYLLDKGLIKARQYLGGGFLIERIYPEGIDIIEHEDKFKSNFGFGINLGLINFSWSRGK